MVILWRLVVAGLEVIFLSFKTCLENSHSWVGESNKQLQLECFTSGVKSV
jgi:hypothetical protein